MAFFEKTIPVTRLGAEMRKLARWAPQVGVELHRGVLEAFFLELPGRSPVGKWGEDEHPGKYRGSHLPSVGPVRFARLPDKLFYAIPDHSLLDPVLSKIKADTPGSQVTNDAATLGAQGKRARRRRRRRYGSYAAFLEDGGSSQARDGIYKPSLAATVARGAKLAEQAIARAMARYPRR